MKLQESLALIKSKFNKTQLADFDAINELDEIKLASMGSNDTEGYQIFTPEFIVKDMVKSIGEKDVFDIEKTVLEPTSGDGAFTVYILYKRLEKVYKEDNDSFVIESLKALSTIYSIEMDKELILKQRNNIFTCVKQFVNKNKIDVSEVYFELVKCVITTNFMWAMFNTSVPDGFLLGLDVAYRMPDVEMNNFKSLDMPVWNVSSSEINFHYEGVDLW